MQLIFGLLFGILGLLVATPLTVIPVDLVKLLYIEDRVGRKLRCLELSEPWIMLNG